MKVLVFAALASLLILSTSCKKEVILETPLSGLWIGTYNILDGGPLVDSLYYSFHLRPDSLIQVHSVGADGNTYYGRGTWSVTGNDFSAVITTSNLSQEGTTQTVSGVFNKAAGTLDGTVVAVNGPFRASFGMFRTN